MKGHGAGQEDSSRQRKQDVRPLVAVLGLTFVALITSICLLWFVASEQGLQAPGKVLILTAHPDDETVFFGPTITGLTANGFEVFLYCLTRGNARGLGELRVKELAYAASALKIDERHLRIENNEQGLPDSKTIDWDLQLAVQLLDEQIKRRSIDTIITFDRGGITGHKNHISCWQAVRRYVTNCSQKGCPTAYAVLTAGYNQHYNHLFGQAPSASRLEANRAAKFVNKHLWRVFWAMHYHKSQWRWWSHVLFTRYTYVNVLYPIDARSTPAMST